MVLSVQDAELNVGSCSQIVVQGAIALVKDVKDGDLHFDPKLLAALESERHPPPQYRRTV